MTKSEIRQKFKALRQQLKAVEIDEASLKIANQLLNLSIWSFDYYHLFLTIDEQNEVHTDYILNILSGKDKNIIVSKSDFERFVMTHYLLTDNTKLVKNAHHIPEPIDGIEIDTSKIEVVFVPLLACDLKGNRVGYGKGFYDKFLGSSQKDCIKIGLSIFDPIDTIDDVSSDDIPLDFCVTPRQIYKFNPR